ncbi:MAG TPA: response regulator [Flavitalea sp.]|nr:response regulator [Flavitalea sp.]
MNKVLVINRDDDLLDLVKRVLSQRNLVAKTIKTKDRVMEIIDDFQPDAILIDIENDKDGDLVNEIKQHLSKDNTPVMLMVGDTGYDIDYSRFSADDYIKKPFDSESLANMIKKNVKEKTA